jgi:uncharacterized phage-associated protein
MSETANVVDVAQYILDQRGPITTWKLQKLCYYSQAWSLVWDDEPLFDERIEAWANGPVIPDLYSLHRSRYTVGNLGGDAGALDADQEETVDAVLAFYGDKSSSWLSELTHREAPWLNARRRDGLGPGLRGTAEIQLDEMAEYYGGLYAGKST